MRFLLQVAALVLFIFAALAAFGVITGWGLLTIVGLIATGLACLAASGLSVPTGLIPPRPPA